ncbi:MAG: bifunctional 3-deoxy-7-phosphoheptulonate synthase/chorismate mutase [bacterium]
MKDKDEQKLVVYRKKVNEIDGGIIKLLSERRQLSFKIVEAKNEIHIPIRDQEREAELLNRLIETGKKFGLESSYVMKLFYEIIDDSLRIQQSYLHGIASEDNGEKKHLKISIQGIEGSYSYLAAKQFFIQNESNLVFISHKRFEDVVHSVEKGEADFAMLPIENTTSGSINEVYDLLLHTTLSIIGEEKFKVKHCLVGIADISPNRIEKIYAHYQAAAQCSKYLASLPEVRIEYFDDTAMSVKKIIEENNKTFAAIASEEAAKLFNVNILKREIANQTENFTRFLIAARTPIKVDPSLPSKTSLVMSTSHVPGSLVESLLIFRNFNVNLTKLESRPVLGNPWEEIFYLDFEGSIEDEKIKSLLDELGKHTRFFKILGCYPSRDIPQTLPKLTEGSAKSKKESGKKESEKIPEAPKGKVAYKLASRQYKKTDTIISVKGIKIGGDNFVVISGPCSVESKEQIITCATFAKKHGSQILRGGCFKPRTSPYSFQGLEFEGIDYLVTAGKKNQMPVITEVLSPEHMFEVAKHVDIIQIGARNMQNFALLKEAGKTTKPILLKRGMMSSIDELLNAAEYILAQGNRQVILCERGIRTFETATRNTLDLSAVVVLKERTHLPVIVDPSHAVGDRNKVIPLAKAAKAVGAHGIMIEFHPDPDKAMSDGDQSLTFNQFEQMMDELEEMK